MSEQQNNSHLSGRAGLKPNQCHKVHRRRKILLNHDARCHLDAMERFKKLIYDVKNDEKLSDDRIDAANKLLSSQFKELHRACPHQLLVRTYLSKGLIGCYSMQCMLITRVYIQEIIGLLLKPFQVMKFTYTTAFF